jgi:serine/threonine protein kinase
LFAIIRGIAQGILYLHLNSGLNITHRDLKLSNILLDFVTNPKISNFCTAVEFHLYKIQKPDIVVGGTR